jgi:hypothetical protein
MEACAANPDGSNAIQLTFMTAIALTGRWSPDGHIDDLMLVENFGKSKPADSLAQADRVITSPGVAGGSLTARPRNPLGMFAARQPDEVFFSHAVSKIFLPSSKHTPNLSLRRPLSRPLPAPHVLQ